MSKKFPINNFAQGGINSDLMPWDLPGNFLTHVNNARIKNGKLMPGGGQASVATLPIDFNPVHLLFVNGIDGDYWLVMGEGAVYAYDYSTFTDVSNALGYTGVTDDFWTGCILGGIPVINSASNYPEYWSPQEVSTPMTDLPWDADNAWRDVGQQCAMIRSHKQFLFALDLTDNSTPLRDWVAWSQPADSGGVPETWDFLDTTKAAGRVPLGTNGGRILDGLSLRDSFIVYRENGVSIFDYVGGILVWQVRQMSGVTGSIYSNSIVELQENHMFIGDGDIYINDGNKIYSALHDRLTNTFRSDLNPDFMYRSFALRNDSNSEAWFCVPTADSEVPNKAYIYNYRDNTWTIRDLPSVAHAAYGENGVTATTWNTISGAWNQNTSPWERRNVTPSAKVTLGITKPAGAGQSGELVMLDNFQNIVVEPYNVLIERTGLAIEGVETTTTINRIFPNIKGPGSVLITMGSQQYPGAPVNWKSPETFDPNAQRSLTTRTTGELHCFRIENVDDSPWEFAGMLVEYVYSGQR